MNKLFGVALTIAAACLGACGGGGSSGSSTHTVKVTVAGIPIDGLPSGTALKLANNDGSGINILDITANGIVSFGAFSTGTPYAITVYEATDAKCIVGGGTGTVGSTDVLATVTCIPDLYSVGFTITGVPPGYSLEVVWQNGLAAVGGNEQTFPGGANTNDLLQGSDGFLLTGAPYAITVEQPEWGNCTVQGGTGIMGSSNITATIVCRHPLVAVSGTISGLQAPEEVDLNFMDVTKDGGALGGFVKNGPFSIEDYLLAAGDAYNVTISPSTSASNCQVIGGSGVVGLTVHSLLKVYF